MYSPRDGGYPREDFQKFIESNHTAAISVSSPEWETQVTTVFYAVEGDMSILIKSHTTSDHGKVISARPDIQVALAIHDPGSTYTDKAGVQLRGICDRITDKVEMEKAVSIYSKAFPGAAERFAPINELISPEAKSTLFRIKIISGKMLTPDGYSNQFQDLRGVEE